MVSTVSNITPNICVASDSKTSRVRQNAGVSDQSHGFAGPDHLRAVQQSLGCRTLLSLGQGASAHQAFPWDVRECGQDSGVDRRGYLRVDRHCAQAPEIGPVVAFDVTDSERDAIRNNPFASVTYRQRSDLETG